MNESRSFKAIHLAAGQGKRLRPITDDKPKPLVELGGESLLERNFETLKRNGVEDQVVVTGYRADKIRELNFETVYNDVYDKTDMVYSLFCAEEEFPENGDLIISYGDIVYEDEVVKSLIDCEAPVCVIIDKNWQELWETRFEDPLDDAETLKLTDDGLIKEIGQEPEQMEEIEGQYIGLIKIHSDYIEEFAEYYHKLTEGEKYASVEMTHYLQSLIDKGWDIKAVPIEGGWLEIDTIKELDKYRKLINSNSKLEHISWLISE